MLLYWRYVRMSIKAQMQYRASFFMAFLSQLLAAGTEFFAIWALFERFGSLRGWSLAQIAVFYGVTNVAFALAEGTGRGFDIFADMVKSGDFDRLLMRPRSTALQVAGMEMQLMRGGRLLQGLCILIWGMHTLHLGWNALALCVLIMTLVGGACLFLGLFVLQATLAFWTVESLEIMNTVTYGGTEVGQYPLTIYGPGLRRFFTFVVPLACINYLPLNVLLRATAHPATGALIGGFAPIAGILFLIISLQFWNLGVRHYRSTGS